MFVTSVPMTTAKIRDKPNFLVLLNKQRTAPKTTSGIINPSSPKVVKNFATYLKNVQCIEPKKWKTHKSKDEKTLSIFSPRVSKIGYIMLKTSVVIYYYIILPK